MEISPTAKPPVCKIMDIGKYKYEQSKKLHQMKQHQKVIVLKEVKLRPYTEEHDLEYKINHIRQFLADGNKAKVTLTFKGRELSHIGLAKNLLDKIVKNVEDIGKVEQQPKLEGRNMIMIVVPK